mmetsp:Transcript_17408/g.54372  ORF Transcript_17408/g.54372 Transcript_17408/m.54372 type:complete len:204 (-) Transcript_17408:254-865(-)
MYCSKATTHDAAFLSSVIGSIEKSVVPLTAAAVKEGNKVFGACVLKKADLSVIVAETNREMEWPLLHGEVSALRSLQKVADRPAPGECVFVATHEPCSLCLSAITWSGYDNFYYLFTYQDTKDAFSIPHDLKILAEVFKCENGAYCRSNAFWTAYSIGDLVAALPDDQDKADLQARIRALALAYDDMSKTYQASKADNNIPLS